MQGRLRHEDLAPASWACYFGEEDYKADDVRVRLIEQLAEFLCESEGWDFLRSLRRSHGVLVLPVDFEHLCERSGIQDLRLALQHQPQNCIRCIGAAVYEVRSSKPSDSSSVRSLSKSGHCYRANKTATHESRCCVIVGVQMPTPCRLCSVVAKQQSSSACWVAH